MHILLYFDVFGIKIPIHFSGKINSKKVIGMSHCADLIANLAPNWKSHESGIQLLIQGISDKVTF